MIPPNAIQACDRITWHFGDSSPDAVVYGTAAMTHIYSSRGLYALSVDIDNSRGHYSSAPYRQLITSDPPTVVNVVNPMVYVSENSGEYVVSLERSGNLAPVSTVTWDVSPENVTPRVPASSGSITFAPSETHKSFSVPIIDDDYYEGSSSHFVDIRASDGTAFGTDCSPSISPQSQNCSDVWGVGFIVLDDEHQPTASIADARMIEGTGGARSADFVVTMSSPMVFDETALGFPAAGTARPGLDFATSPDGARPILCTIPAGSTTCTLHVPIMTDSEVEPDETFTISFRFNNLPEPNIMRAQATGTIVDDDVEFTPGAPTLIAGTRVRVRIRVGQPFSSKTTLPISCSAPDVVQSPLAAVFPAGGTATEIELTGLRSGSARVSMQMPNSRGGGHSSLVVYVQGLPPRHRSVK